MNPDTDDIEYARTQHNEAMRRLESVKDRVSEGEKRGVVGAIDQRKDELIIGEEVEEIPDQERQFVMLNESQKETRRIEPHIQNIIIDCQMCIELSVKSMFKAVGQSFDYSHGITFESHNTDGFNDKIPSDFPRNNEIARSIFLTQLWEEFYQLAKYGAPTLNVGPSEIFEINDGERAINDASFCVNLAEDLITYMESREQ